jgi:single-strand DNA-binding protein
MAEGLNRVTLLGNLGADPELRYTQGGQAVLNIRLATTESYLDKDRVRKERTDWHAVVLWGKRGEALGKFLTKGSQILVEGRLSTSSYDDRDGNKRYKTEVVANNVVLVGGRSRGGGAEESFGGPPADFGGGGPPRRAPGPAPAQRPAQAAPAHDPADDFAGGGDFGGGDDDIPF